MIEGINLPRSELRAQRKIHHPISNYIFPFPLLLCVRSFFLPQWTQRFRKGSQSQIKITTERTEGAEKIFIIYHPSSFNIFPFHLLLRMRSFFYRKGKEGFAMVAKGRFPFPALTSSFGNLPPNRHLCVLSYSGFNLPPSSFKK